MKKISIILFLGLLIIALAWKLWTSEQLRIAWNHPLFFYDGRHKLSGTDRSVNFDLQGELWVRDKASGKFIRIIPNAGIEFCDEQNISFSSARDGKRKMLKIRPMRAADAENDFKISEKSPIANPTNDFMLFFEQRNYDGDNLISYHKDFAFGNGGLFFVNPETGAHIAKENFSTVYVPEPLEKNYAGPKKLLWAAAANRKFVEDYVDGKIVPPPKNKFASGKKGQLAFDENFAYFYIGKSNGWIRIKIDKKWK